MHTDAARPTVQRTSRAGIGLVACLAVGLAVVSSGAVADTITGEINANTLYEQTSDSAPTTPAFYWFNMAAYFSTPGDFTSGSATYPGPDSPQTLIPNGSPAFPAVDYTSPTYATLGDMHAAFPFGTYTITASGPAGTETANVPYAADHFTSGIPYVTNFGDLAGLDPTQQFTFQFPAFTPDPAASESYTFLTIYDAATSAAAFSQDFLPPSTTSVTLPAGTLLPDTGYFFDLIYENRLVGTDPVNGTFTAQLFDARTDGDFTTASDAVAVPEPAALGVFGFGALLVGAFVGLRQRTA